MDGDLKKCRACGADYPVDTPMCPRCRVPRKGDINRPAIAAYGLFLFVMLLLAIGMLLYFNKA